MLVLIPRVKPIECYTPALFHLTIMNQIPNLILNLNLWHLHRNLPLRNSPCLFSCQRRTFCGASPPAKAKQCQSQ